MDGLATPLPLPGSPLTGKTPQRTTQNGQTNAAIRQAAEDYEALFLAEMLAPIFETLETDGPFGGGNAERIFRSLLVQEYGKSLAESGGVGIADAVERELLKLQETQA